MPGQTRSANSGTARELIPREIRAIVDEAVDLFSTVWLGAECYHTHRGALGPGCPEHIGKGSLRRGTLVEAAELGLRPCGNCNPADYRRDDRQIVTDGGFDVAIQARVYRCDRCNLLRRGVPWAVGGGTPAGDFIGLDPDDLAEVCDLCMDEISEELDGEAPRLIADGGEDLDTYGRSAAIEAELGRRAYESALDDARGELETDEDENNAHASALIDQLRIAEWDEDLDPEVRDRARERRESLEGSR